MRDIGRPKDKDRNVLDIVCREIKVRVPFNLDT